MLLVIDMDRSLVAYSGTAKVCLIHASPGPEAPIGALDASDFAVSPAAGTLSVLSANARFEVRAISRHPLQLPPGVPRRLRLRPQASAPLRRPRGRAGVGAVARLGGLPLRLSPAARPPRQTRLPQSHGPSLLPPRSPCFHSVGDHALCLVAGDNGRAADDVHTSGNGPTPIRSRSSGSLKE